MAPSIISLGGGDWLLIAGLALLLAVVLKRHLRHRSSSRLPELPLLVYPYTPPAEVTQAQADDPRCSSPEGDASGDPASPGISHHALAIRFEHYASGPAGTRPEAGGLEPARARAPARRFESGGPQVLQVVQEPNGPSAAESATAKNVLPPPGNGSYGHLAKDGRGPVQTDRRDEADDVQNATLQLLPGRLDVVAGLDQGLQIRFMRQKAGEATEYTLGRAPSVAFKHVHIRGVTVSRVHASMRYIGGRWTLVNQSATNPTRIGGRELIQRGEAHPLADGDTIELGEVLLRFTL